MRRIPTDLEILTTIYDRYYEEFESYSPEHPNRSSKIMVPIDIRAIAKELGTNPYILFGRLFHCLDKRHGYPTGRNERVAFFAPRAGADVHCINFPMLEGVISDLRDERNVGRPRQTPAFETFPTSAGTTWREIRLTVTGFELRIESKGSAAQYSYKEVGFEDKRRKEIPDTQWDLLTLFALSGRILQSDDRRLGANRQVVKNRISQLRRRIRTLIPGVEGDPIPYVWGERCYRTAFEIQHLENFQIWAPAGTTWSRVSVAEVEKGMIQISYPKIETTTASQYADIEGERVHQREFAQEERTVTHEYDLRTLGLENENGKVSPVGKTFLTVLRNVGTIEATGSNKEMIRLNEYLTHLLNLDDPPFDFSEKCQTWSARFEASSREPSSPR